MGEFLGTLKALADETRLNIISLLLTHDFCVGVLAKRLGISEAAVSQHLQILKKVGVLKGEKRGYYTHYCVDREVLKKVGEKIMEMSAQTPLCKGGRCNHAPGGHQCKKHKEE